MEKFEQEELLDKYRKGICSPQEKAVVENWYNKQSALSSDDLSEPDYDKVRNEIWNDLLSNRIKNLNADKEVPGGNFKLMKLLAVASLFIVMGLGFCYMIYNKSGKQTLNQYTNVIKPGGNKAYLVLSDGKRIELSDTINGTVAVRGGVQISKTGDGQLLCKVMSAGSADTKGYNTLVAPKGGLYEITLIDGTKVWLNSTSTLKYPISFSATERKVELTGEAYFEVAKNKNKPFRVISDEQEIEVLGTHFNVNAYHDEGGIKTTLIEGSVRVSHKISGADNQYRILKPGQQSVLQSDLFKVKEVDLEEAIAWKNGYFIFDNDDLEGIMRKLGRWYDIDVIYNGVLDNKVRIIGTISKNTELSEVLKMLESTDKFKFKTEGRRVTVML